MKRRSVSAAWALAKGLLAAVAVTLAGMLLLAAAVIFLRLDDGPIRVMNQVIKALAVTAGVLAAVGPGGKRGLITGAALGTAYAVAGYAMYVLLGGCEFSLAELMGEILIAAAAGSAAGVVLANMRPRGKRRQSPGRASA